MRNVGWHSDAFDGVSSSMDVLLQWLSVPGNVARWLEPALVKDGKRDKLSDEVHKLLVANGIMHRTPSGIQKKIWYLFNQFGEAEKWLDRKSIRHFNANGKTERKVLRMCPSYRELEPLLHPSRSPRGIKPQVHVAVARPSKAAQHALEDNAEVGSKPTGLSASYEDEASKHIRWEDHPSDSQASGEEDEAVEEEEVEEVEEEDSSELCALLEADSDARCELFRLEIQSKRDEAVLVRATARKELLQLGFSLDRVDQLLPL